MVVRLHLEDLSRFLCGFSLLDSSVLVTEGEIDVWLDEFGLQLYDELVIIDGFFVDRVIVEDVRVA